MTVPVEQPREPKTDVPRKSTQGLVNYAKRTDDPEVFYTAVKKTEDGGRSRETNIQHDARQVEVHDIRSAQKSFSLQKEGFVSRLLHVPAKLDWQNDAEVRERYYPAVEQLIKEVTGASRVLIFDHTGRFGHASIETIMDFRKNDSSKPNNFNQGPVSLVHVDYDQLSGIDRLDALLPEEAHKLRETPFAVIQVWKPLKGPVQSSPLGMIDASTVEREDMRTKELRLPDRVGRNFAIYYNPKHRWYYTEQQSADEAYLFVCYDSRTDRARFTPHTGFVDLSTPEGAPPRESIEIRSYVFWEHDPPQKVERTY